VYPALQAAGVKVIAVTAEPGGADAVRARLTERGVETLDYEIQSDPEHESLKLLGSPPEDTFVFLDHEWDVSGNYKMIQPAVFVLDADGAPIPACTWSWKTMGIEDPLWNTLTTTASGKQVPLVVYRPVMTDMLASIQEKRQVKLGFAFA